MAQIKNNLAPREPSLAYRVHSAAQVVASSAAFVSSSPEGAPVAAESRDHATTPVIEWLGECTLSADQLLAAAGIKPCLLRPRDKAKEFLLNFLNAGPRSTIDIWQAGKQDGHSKRTLQRAAEGLSIRSKTVMTNNRQLTYWLLEHQKLPPDVDPKDPDIPSLEPWLAPLREQYPADPLDGDL
jgi:hypothetical protein